MFVTSLHADLGNCFVCFVWKFVKYRVWSKSQKNTKTRIITILQRCHHGFTKDCFLLKYPRFELILGIVSCDQSDALY